MSHFAKGQQPYKDANNRAAQSEPSLNAEFWTLERVQLDVVMTVLACPLSEPPLPPLP